MSEFDAIRPYDDEQVPEVLARLMADSEFLDSIAKFKLPRVGKFLAPLARGLVKKRLHEEFNDTQTVTDFQAKIESYLDDVMERTVDELTVSGLEHLDRSRAHLFISNHRDIAMDPAFVNWNLFKNGFSTLRIAIGDNLLTKPFASDLMRLNKSFIVNRSATAPREKLKAAKLLSKYIHHSVVNDNENVWIAQREGRAKDGLDVTNPAIISMLMLNKAKPDPFEDYLRALQIVPVSISYEFDPCDEPKARELYEREKHGDYKKGEHEDVKSIAQGIVGFKGNVHLSFGEPIIRGIENAEQLTENINAAIRRNYVLHPTNCFAYEMIEKKSPKVVVGAEGQMFDNMDFDRKRESFKDRISQTNSKYHDILLRMYANPVYQKLENQ